MPAERCDKPTNLLPPQHTRTTTRVGASLGCAQPASACGCIKQQNPIGLGGISTGLHQKAGTTRKDLALGTPLPPVLLPDWGHSRLQQGTQYLLDGGLLGDIIHHTDHVGLQERSGNGW